MKVLLFIASHDPHLTENPFFLQFSNWLNANNEKCLVSVPKNLNYLKFGRKTKVVYRSNRIGNPNISFARNIIRMFISKNVHTLFPFNYLKELAWKPDKVFVFSDSFFDFEFYNNTWILNIFKARNTPIIKINAYQPIFDNADTFLKEKHRLSLDVFTKIVFTQHENKTRVERVLSQSIKSKIILEESNSITISEGKANENKIKIYCPFPLNLNCYRQDLLIEACSRFRDENISDIGVTLNPVGLTKQSRHLYDDNVDWQRLNTSNKPTFTAIFLVSEYGYCSEFKSILNQTEFPVYTNIKSPLNIINIFTAEKVNINSILYFLRSLDKTKKYSVSIDFAINKTLFNDMLS